MKKKYITRHNFIWNFYILNYLTSLGSQKSVRGWDLVYIWQTYNNYSGIRYRNQRGTKVITNTSTIQNKSFFKFNRKRLRASYNPLTSESKQPNPNSIFFKKSLTYFQIFLSNNPTHPNNLFKVHHVYIRYGLYQQNGQLWPFNILRFYGVWKNFFKLVHNMFYYRVNTLFLGSLFFKNETNALNFGVNGHILNIFKYVNYGFFNINLRTNPNLKGMYSILKSSGFKSAFIFDLFNHQFTAQHLYNTKYFTVALTPITHFNPQISFNIPMMSSNLTNQLFFYRFILKIKKSTLNSRYNQLKVSWNLRKLLNEL